MRINIDMIDIFAAMDRAADRAHSHFPKDRATMESLKPITDARKGYYRAELETVMTNRGIDISRPYSWWDTPDGLTRAISQDDPHPYTPAESRHDAQGAVSGVGSGYF